MPEIRDLLRHSTITMTERYAHLAPHNVRAAVRILEGNISRSSFTLPGMERNGGDELATTV